MSLCDPKRWNFEWKIYQRWFHKIRYSNRKLTCFQIHFGRPRYLPQMTIIREIYHPIKEVTAITVSRMLVLIDVCHAQTALVHDAMSTILVCCLHHIIHITQPNGETKWQVTQNHAPTIVIWFPHSKQPSCPANLAMLQWIVSFTNRWRVHITGLVSLSCVFI